MAHPAGRWLWLAALTLAYPLAALVVSRIPNPMVPGANLALNMIFPVVAGYLLGPRSGLVAGGVGTGLSALAGVGGVFDGVSILPHALMGWVAGRLGQEGSEIMAAFALVVGHAANIVAYGAFGLMPWSGERLAVLVMRLVTETAIGVAATVLLGRLLKARVYQEDRW